jgi:hypothetical protein
MQMKDIFWQVEGFSIKQVIEKSNLEPESALNFA